MSQKNYSDDVVKEWFDQLPEGWSLRRLRTLGRFTSSGIDKKNVEGEPLVRMVNYTDVYGNSTLELRNSPDYMVVSCPANKVEEHGLVQGDMLFTPSSETPEDIGVSAIVMEVLLNTVYSYHITRFRMRDEISLHYRKYLCNHPRVLRQFSRLCKGTTRQILVREDFKSAWVAIPPTQQQDQIAGYLDEQTGKIDRLLDMRRRQMALLKEQRAALIQQAVTRGLNPNAPMKDSGLSWLGEIPAHWKTVPLGYLAILLQTGPFGSQLHAHEYIESGIPVINPSHMADGLIQPDPKCTVDEATAKRLSRHFLQFGDVVFARRGELGRCALVRDEEVGWICGTGSLLMRPEIRTIEPQFLVTLFKLKHLKESLTLQSVGSTMDNLNTGILSQTGLPLPPLCEQNEILIFIDEQRAKFDTLHDSYTRQLSLLSEYRVALIHECVTGQRTVPETSFA